MLFIIKRRPAIDSKAPETLLIILSVFGFGWYLKKSTEPMIITHHDIDPAKAALINVTESIIVSGASCIPMLVKIAAKKIIINGFEIVSKNVDVNAWK